MKFLCGNCKAKYQIADEKIGRRTLRMVCRQCGKEILIQPPHHATVELLSSRAAPGHSAPIAAAPSVLAADFHRQVTGGVSDRAPSPALNEWFVAINDIPVGPMHREEVARKITLGAISGESLAWREGLDDWMPARNIPELAGIFAQSTSQKAPARTAETLDHRYIAQQHLPIEEEPIVATARSSVSPIGGRLDVPQTVDDFIPPAPSLSPTFEEVSISPMAEDASPQTRQGQSWGPMFVMVCGGALIMMIGVVVGVKMLGGPTSTTTNTTTNTTTSTNQDKANKPAPTEAPATPHQSTGEVVQLELQEIGGDLQKEPVSGQPKKNTSQGPNGKGVPSAKGKELSSDEKAMLARMGGDLNQNASQTVKIKSSSDDVSGGNKEGLKAEQLSAVVARGKQQLQQCYETALRANPSNETLRLDIDLTVGMSGTVVQMVTRGKSLGDMNECIKRIIRMWRFPTAGNETRTSFPVVFQPGV
jgi:hypothetical protein